MPKALWNGAVIAQAEQTQVVDGYTYFPPESVRWEHFRDSPRTSVCSWKGTASYYDVIVGDAENPGAAWVYRDPKDAAKSIAGHIAFWRGVKIED